MSAGQPCTHDGCPRAQTSKSARELCPMHYKRLVAGYDMDAPPRRTNFTQATFEELLKQDTDDCVLWPHGITKQGYGKTTHNGRQSAVHVLALELVVGPRPTPHHDAMHACRNRHCMNVRHLRWGTRSENSLDRHRDGTCTQAKLTPGDVVVIRRHLADRDCTQAELAERYGVSVSTIEYIKARRVWAHIKEAA